jgi:hypothetical protein
MIEGGLSALRTRCLAAATPGGRGIPNTTVFFVVIDDSGFNHRRLYHRRKQFLDRGDCAVVKRKLAWAAVLLIGVVLAPKCRRRKIGWVGHTR